MIKFLLGLWNPLQRVLDLIDNKIDNETERQAIKADVLKTHVNARAQTLGTAMMHGGWIFWSVWAMYNFPPAIWWTLVWIDTWSGLWDLSIPPFPDTIKPYFDKVFDSMFVGGGVLGVQVIGRYLQGTRK